jgi:hypothetical protein
MEIPYENRTVTLQAITPDTPEEVLVQLCILSEGGTTSDIQFLPEDLQLLLKQFTVVFEDPTSLVGDSPEGPLKNRGNPT